MVLSYFDEIHSKSGFGKHQIIAHLGYILSLGQMDYVLQHWITGDHKDFQDWVRPVYVKFSVLFIFWYVLFFGIWNYYKRK